METSIIVPAYNEEKRMFPFVKELICYANENLKDYEIIFVNDGSTDSTKEKLKEIVKQDSRCKILSYKKNRGKGFAVKYGFDHAIGKNLIFIDIDGSISPDEILNVLNALKNSDLVIGDRYENRKNIKQPLFRKFAGTLFNCYVNILYNLDIKDTLCGIKGFKKEVAEELFKNLMSYRWVFDVEILYYAKKKKMNLIKLPIKWVHKEGTKIKLRDPFKMALRLLVLRFKLLLDAV